MALTAEQKKIRRTGVTASEIAAVCGLNPWASPGDVWSEKLEMKEEWEGNEDTERGNELEHALVNWTGRRLGKPAKTNTETFRSKKDEIALATPDGFLLDRTVEYQDEEMTRTADKWIATIEAKAPSWRTAKDWRDPTEVIDGCPKYFLVQAQYQAGVLGLEEAIVSGLVDGRLWVYRLPFSEALYRALIDRAKEFWRYVERREPPPFAPGQSTRWVGEVYREQTYKDLVEPLPEKLQDILDAAHTYALARDEAGKAKLNMSAAKGYLCALIEQHEGLNIPGWKCTWKQAGPKRETDWAQIARTAMDKLAGVVSIEEMDKWIVENTKVTPGSRTFLLRED